MPYFIHHLAGAVGWRIGVAAPVYLPGPELGRYRILNPRAYQHFAGFLADHAVGHSFVQGHDVIIETRALILYADTIAVAEPSVIQDEFELVSRFLRRLRYLSRQATLATEVMALAGPCEAPTPPETWLPPPTSVRASLRQYITDWAVSEALVREAIATVDEPVPVHHELLLDSQRAATRSEHRIAILFAAMACETLAGSAADAAQAQRKASGDDVVFRYLRTRAKFAQLLHEVCMYSRGTSLLLSNETLYQRAFRLYKTRNKIAHEGIPPEEGSYLPISAVGALEAIETSIQVFEWFDEGARYTNPLRPTFLKIP